MKLAQNFIHQKTKLKKKTKTKQKIAQFFLRHKICMNHSLTQPSWVSFWTCNKLGWVEVLNLTD